MSGRDDPRPHAPELLRRALAALLAPARAGRIRLRADTGCLAGELARAALFAEVEFASGAGAGPAADPPRVQQPGQEQHAVLGHIQDGGACDTHGDAEPLYG